MTDFAAPSSTDPVAPAIKVTTRSTYDAPESLSPSTVLSSPLLQFKAWFAAAQGHVVEPEAMSLSTSTASGVPSSRIVLLKEVDTRGFVLFTNYTSRKSAELKANPRAALVFYWKELHKQVRVVGRAEMVDRRESEAYYNSRPIGSRIGAWASRQSTVVGEGEVKERYEKLEERFGVKKEGSDASVHVPLPEFWGGWRIVPDEVEFWVGKPSRLHDRVRYLRQGDSDEWKIERLAP